MDSRDLQTVKTKIIQAANAPGQGEAQVRLDWPEEPLLPLRARPGVKYSDALGTLNRREVRSGSAAAAVAIAPEWYVEQLNAMVDKINYLSAEQEQAIAAMQTIQANLSQLQPWGSDPGSRATPSLDIKRAALAAAEVDAWGNILLSYRTIKAAPTPQQAYQSQPSPGTPNQLAAQLRLTYGSPVAPRGSSWWRNLINEALTLGQEPAQILAHLGRRVGQMAQKLVHSGISSPALPTKELTSLSLTDSALWFGGGVIGRLALNLLLAAFPALWSVAVAAITAMTAYALYRATLAPKLAFGPAIRVFLLVVGLVVGGQL